MKFNWGTGIALFFSAFVLAMLGLVFASSAHDPGLVQKDYYNLDINYQAHLEKKQNTASLAALPQVVFQGSDKIVAIKFPADMHVTEGTARFYRSSTPGDDFVINLKDKESLAVPVEKLAAGRWHVELDWGAADGRKFYWETTVNVM